MNPAAHHRRGHLEGQGQASKRANTCPWPCLYDGHHGELVDRAGIVRATWCDVCDQVITRGQWAAELKRAAAA